MYNEDLGIDIPDEIDDGVVEDALMGILTGEWTTEDTMLLDARFVTYERDGVMTYNKGIVIKLPSGENFQLTIVRSR